MPASKIPPDIRAAAIADLMAGEQPAVVAERYRLNLNMVRVWKYRYVEQNGRSAPLAIVEQHAPIGALLLDLLAAKLRASLAIAQAASDPAWLAGQSGSDLAALGYWVDSSALALGDRLVSRAPRLEDTD